MLRFGFVLLCLMMITAPVAARAAQACYAPTEAEADQGIRIHSELMVIGLNCQHMGTRKGYDFYGQYREFTQRNGKLFATYEKILMNFFKKKGEANPEAALNTLRTSYANKISREAAQMRPDVFCAQYTPRMKQAASMSQGDLRRWAATFHPAHPLSYQLCKASAG